jgi:hypothetical protein
MAQEANKSQLNWKQHTNVKLSNYTTPNGRQELEVGEDNVSDVPNFEKGWLVAPSVRTGRKHQTKNRANSQRRSVFCEDGLKLVWQHKFQ